MKYLVEIMLSRVFALLYPLTYSEFESIKATWQHFIGMWFLRSVAILRHLTTPPLLELLVILNNDVLWVEFSESVLELRIVGEVAE